MAVTAYWYRHAFTTTFEKETDITADSLFTALTSNSAPNQDTHDYWNDAVGNEIANGNGYTTNGFDHSAATTSTTTTKVWSFDLDDALWQTSTITAYYAIVYNRTPAADTQRPLLTYVDFGGAQSSSGGDFKIVWNASGVAKVTVS